VFASSAGATETAADAPEVAAEGLGTVVGEVAEVEPPPVLPPLVLVGFTKNGAENRCGLVKSS
jgi:hypothetical protein